MNELRIQNVPEQLHKDILKMLECECMTAPELIRPMLNDILNDYSEEMKTTMSIGDKKSIRIRGISPKKHQQLKNIASHLGITPQQLVMLKLKSIIDEYPLKLR